MDEAKLSREEFAEAASTAVRAVLDLYGEIDALLRELDDAMRADGFQAWHAIPGGAKKGSEDNRVLREWKGRLYVPATEDEGGDEEETEDLENTDEETEEDARRAGPRELPRGTPVAFVRARIYRARETTYEPEVLYGVLSNPTVKADGFPPTEPFRIKRGSINRILAALEVTASKEVQSRAAVLAPPKTKIRARDRMLVFTVPAPFKSTPLYEIDDLRKVRDIAESLRETFRGVSANM